MKKLTSKKIIVHFYQIYQNLVEYIAEKKINGVCSCREFHA